jgi:6-pyruvoyltetrahydropterin/6-carboxytetrahydropterin synthase
MSEFYRIRVDTHFTAAHQLRFTNGEKENLHRHKWGVTAVLSSEKLNKIGLVVDFNHLKKDIDRITEGISGDKMLGHKYFRDNNCSAENVARYIYYALKPRLVKDVKLESIEVEEEPGFRAEFSEKGN